MSDRPMERLVTLGHDDYISHLHPEGDQCGGDLEQYRQDRSLSQSLHWPPDRYWVCQGCDRVLTEPAVATDEPTVRLPNGSRPLYVNVYVAGREYGGPEEGGWWYDTGTPYLTVICINEAQARHVQEMLRQDYPFTRKRYSVLGGEDWDVVIEDHVGTYYPQERPHYE